MRYCMNRSSRYHEAATSVLDAREPSTSTAHGDYSAVANNRDSSAVEEGDELGNRSKCDSKWPVLYTLRHYYCKGSNTIDDRVTADGGAEPSATDLNAAAHGGAAPDSIVEVQEDESESAVAATGPKE
ncbi:hypothetical protein PPTG_25034 [Phytophthora nicotianae INRA-310]|uniref:Uncharacterized protein n=1 Tax=Phytophthora nicotianae (strain INRA-310) TaxID=761204 RepID=W2P985_PHYN3|nr:hypothetical protein PPTG_25034 [Phytophthora nicotianae INRA-310]ETM97235.1 hypothetical protein PPTG_25034 [Phytophthora nicotianae INRA-310]